ncbi:MAG TPA: hypothetical protein VOB72_17575 [Candidatus Dormibacteraeota bacterium]|nr:hypothetical protein [Candidatus Dormibacteraeota bacterium]
MSTSPQRVPNLFQVHGRHLHATYSTTSANGKPQFHYQDAHGSQSFEGDAIRTVETEIGTLVTVTIVRTVDSGSTSFTLLVPRVNLGQDTSVPISTEGITTIHRFSIVPAFNHGQTEIYRVDPMRGTASAIQF